MCGISGIINKNNKPINFEKLKLMNKKIEHRGPDGDGFFCENNIGLGHRRLSIIDLSENGKQPMPFKDRYVITYNGEIYNYLELREELISAGYKMTSKSDTEVLLAAYDYWKEDCLTRLNGMWSFAIYDRQENNVFIARDRFGVKPFYYKETEDEFLFGSEIKQLLNDDAPNVVNEDILLEFLLTYYDDHTENTYFKDVINLLPGHYLKYNLETNEKTFVKYYELNINETFANSSLETNVETFKNLMESSINLCMRSDVKVGTCLSGGLDSSVISAIASKNYNEVNNSKFIAINAKSIDKKNDESEFSQIVKDYCNLDLHIVEPSYDDFVKTIDEVVYTQEEPFATASMFMGWQVFKKAKELNCKVMLNGQGGDETFLGYERYFVSYLNSNGFFNFIKNLFSQSKNSRLSLKDIISYFFYFNFNFIRVFNLKRKSLIKKKFIKEAYFNIVKENSVAFKNVKNLQLFELTYAQLPHLLRYEDRNSMRHSIETRLPFLDYRLVEFGISIPIDQKINDGWTKYIIRESYKDLLPETIIWRKNKFGFEAPDQIWLTKYLSEIKFEIQNSKLLNHYIDTNKMLANYLQLPLKEQWIYLNIARWEKVYNIVVE